MAQTRDEERLANAPIGPLMLKLAVPAVAAQVINMLYNIVDRIYIGHIPEVGDIALTGVGVTFPIIMLVSAFAAFAGQGGAPLASIQLGAGDREKAEKILGNSLTLLLIAAAALPWGSVSLKSPSSMPSVPRRTPLAMPWTTSDLSCGYGFRPVGSGTQYLYQCPGQGPGGHAERAHRSHPEYLPGPVFIFGLNMGVKGAALATILSQR